MNSISCSLECQVPFQGSLQELTHIILQQLYEVGALLYPFTDVETEAPDGSLPPPEITWLGSGRI